MGLEGSVAGGCDAARLVFEQGDGFVESMDAGFELGEKGSLVRRAGGFPQGTRGRIGRVAAGATVTSVGDGLGIWRGQG